MARRRALLELVDTGFDTVLESGRAASPGKLTPTERRVAELVGSGHSNHEVARLLFMSAKTVEWNLTKVYQELHVRSRAELAAKLSARRSTR